MVSAEAARNVVGIIGNVISFGLFLSPCPTFYKIIKNKSVEEFKVDPYLATVLNCIFWIFYGLPIVHPDSTLVITINSVGLAIELIYLSIFFFYAPKNGRMKVLLGLLFEVIFVVAVAAGVLAGLKSHTKRSLAFGVICDIFNIIMYASPLTIMKKVITTKSVKYMPFTLSLANFLNGITWTAYALIKFDIYILISNGLGAIAAIAQLILYGWYWWFYKSTPAEEATEEVKKPSRPEIQLAGSDIV